MSDLNTMMREQARNGLQTQLDAAVTNGDAEAARKITGDLEKLAVATAPKAPPYGDVEIKAELGKLDWFGVDPKKSGRAVALGHNMDPKKFPTAAAFAEALVKAVDSEFPAPAAKETDEEREARELEEQEAEEAAAAKGPKHKVTDGPNDGDTSSAGKNRKSSGPWTKLADAPVDVQKEIKRTADRFVSSTAPKEQRESFIAKALESHYAAAQRKKRK